jgi:hypothetical protein
MALWWVAKSQRKSEKRAAGKTHTGIVPAVTSDTSQQR